MKSANIGKCIDPIENTSSQGNEQPVLPLNALRTMKILFLREHSAQRILQ